MYNNALLVQLNRTNFAVSHAKHLVKFLEPEYSKQLFYYDVDLTLFVLKCDRIKYGDVDIIILRK